MAEDIQDLGSSANTMWSSYLIDCSRKCIISGAETASLMGNLDESCLKSLGIGFKEGFTEATKDLQSQFEQLTKPVKIMIQALIAKFPMLTKLGVKVDGSNLREQAIKLYTLYSAFIDGNSNSDVAQQLTAAFEKIYTYNVPFRKTPPQLSMLNSKIVIKFSYGACNVFDAYEEVWKPLQTIKKALFPSQKIEKDDKGNLTGLSTMQGVVVPYAQQGYAALIKGFFPAVSDTGKVIGDSLVSMTSSLKGVVDTVGAADWTNKMQATIDRLEGGGTKSKKQTSFDNVDQAVASIVQGTDPDIEKIKVKAEDLRIEVDQTDKSSNPTLQQHAASGLKQILDKVEDPSRYEYKDGKFQVSDGGLLFGKPAAATTIKITKKAEAEKPKDDPNKPSSMLKIISSLVNIEHKVIGHALIDLNEKIKGKKSFFLGFPNVYVNNQKELSQYCNTDTAKIKIVEVLISAANITFDYSNLDEAGFPMSGTLTIEGVWNINPPEETFVLESIDVGPHLTRQAIPYKDVSVED